MLRSPPTSIEDIPRDSQRHAHYMFLCAALNSTSELRTQLRHESVSPFAIHTKVESRPRTPLSMKTKSKPIDVDEAPVETNKDADNFFANLMRHEDDSVVSEPSSLVSRKRSSSVEPESFSTLKKVFRSQSPKQIPEALDSMVRFQPGSPIPGPSSPRVSTNASIMQSMMAEISEQRRKIQPSPLWDMIEEFPNELATNSDKFNFAMESWMVVAVDEVTVPVIIRPNGIRVVPITTVQSKLYSQFALNVVNHMMKTTTPLHSFFLEPVEAWMYNVINSTVFNHNLGLKVFQSKEECLEIREVELQYWHIKKYHLEQLFHIYCRNIPPETIKKRNVIGTIVKLKSDTYRAIKKIEERLRLLTTPYKFSY